MVEVAHVKAHRTKKEKKNMSHFETFVTEGKEKAEVRADTMKQEREEVYVALQYAACFHCQVEQWKDWEELKPKPKEKWSFVDKRSEGTKLRTERCAEADRYRCRRCGRGSKCVKMPGRCQKVGKMEKAPSGRT